MFLYTQASIWLSLLLHFFWNFLNLFFFNRFLQFPCDLVSSFELQKLSVDQIHHSSLIMTLMLCLSHVQNPQADHCRLQEVGTYCQESRRLDQWVPELVLQERWWVWHQHTWNKNRSFLGSDTREPLGWPGVDSVGLILTDQQEPRTSSQWLVKQSEWRLIYKICFMQKIQTENQTPIQATLFLLCQ